MKRIVGILIVLSLLLVGGQAFGAGTSLIGKKVSKEMTISLNGVEVGKVIVVEGRSYAPVRDFANALELDISATKEKVDLSGEVSTGADTREIDHKIILKQGEIIEVTDIISNAESKQPELEQRIIDEVGKTDYIIESPTVSLEKNKAAVTKFKLKLETLRTELADLEAQKSALEAQ